MNLYIFLHFSNNYDYATIVMVRSAKNYQIIYIPQLLLKYYTDKIALLIKLLRPNNDSIYNFPLSLEMNTNEN